MSDLVLVLGTTQVGQAAGWVFVRYPGLGARTGWVSSSVLGPRSSVNTLLVINRRVPRVRLFKRGRLVLRARAGVGAHESPTPAGRFYVRERLVPRTSDSIYGVLAFGLSAYSRFRTDWPGGGQVGVHGTNEPELTPGHISDGCVRLRNRAVKRLDRMMPIGTPVRIV
jgi:lipoprotein-anchoring transpeptidase ErfK/SrfK